MADTGREQAGGARNDENAEAAGSQGNRAAENSGFFLIVLMYAVHRLFEMNWNECVVLIQRQAVVLTKFKAH